VLSRIGEKEEPVFVGMSWSRDWRILDREVSSEGNEKSSGSCLGIGPEVVIRAEGGVGGAKGGLFTRL